MLRRTLVIVLLGVGAAGVSAEDTKPLPVQAFFSYPQISDAKISPDGKYLALVAASDQTGYDRQNLAIIGMDDRKLKAHFSMIGDESIYDYWWANDERVLVAGATKVGSFDALYADGTLVGINVDGTKLKPVMGVAPNTKMDQADNFTHLKHQTDVYYFESLLALVPDDPRHVIVKGVRRGGGERQQDQAYSLDIYNGLVEPLTKSPVVDGGLIADDKGDVRLAWGNNQLTGDAKAAYRPAGSGANWQDIPGVFNGDDPGGTPLHPEGMTPEGKIYWLGRSSSSTLGLYSLDPATLKQGSLFSDPDVDIDDDVFFSDYGHDGSGLVWSFEYSEPRKVVAVETMPGMPAIHILVPDDLKAQYLAQLYDAFSGQKVEITSNTRDHSKLIVRVSGDRTPGDFYLFDTKTNKAELLFSTTDRIDPDAMSSMQPVTFKSRDGLALHGYLTTPKGVPPKNLPMVLIVHGGPHGIRDRWDWNPEAQFLAYHGYAVLQVNYRGSGGYGMRFQDMGYRHWGTTMQDDLADGVSWAIAQGVADPKRICIYGASYGGYAAFENPIRYPDLYKCAVGYVGAYDLTLLGNTGQAVHYASAENDFSVFLGDNMDERKRQSPVYNADKLKLPLFIAYGGQDQTVVPDHAKRMMDALNKAGVAYEQLYEPDEGHGFRKPENNFELYTRMLAFFDKYIGPGVTPSPAGAAAAATSGK